MRTRHHHQCRRRGPDTETRAATTSAHVSARTRTEMRATPPPVPTPQPRTRANATTVSTRTPVRADTPSWRLFPDASQSHRVNRPPARADTPSRLFPAKRAHTAAAGRSRESLEMGTARRSSQETLEIEAEEAMVMMTMTLRHLPAMVVGTRTLMIPVKAGTPVGMDVTLNRRRRTETGDQGQAALPWDRMTITPKTSHHSCQARQRKSLGRSQIRRRHHNERVEESSKLHSAGTQ